MLKEQKIKINYLVKEIAKKNGDATAELYTMMYEVLFAFLKKVTYDDGWILEAIDKTFDTIIDKADKILYVNCYGWILRTSKNILINILRRETNRKKFLSPLDSFVYEEDICEKLDVQSKLNKLTNIEKQVFYLLHERCYSYKNVSKLLKLSESTIRRKEKEIIDFLENENE